MGVLEIIYSSLLVCSEVAEVQRGDKSWHGLLTRKWQCTDGKPGLPAPSPVSSHSPIPLHQHHPLPSLGLLQSIQLQDLLSQESESSQVS